MMEREMLKLYKRGGPVLIQNEKGNLRGLCPFCGGDGFMAGGLISTSTGDETDDFLSLDCDREGSPEEFLEDLSQFETFDERGSEESPPEIEEKEPEVEAEETEVASNLTLEGENSPLLTLDIPGKELQILLLLQIRRDGL